MIFRLEQEYLVFPPPNLSDEDGLLAVGGDLSVDRLILAYSLGIFPWYSEDTAILWYSPHKRFVIFPEKVKVSKSMRTTINKDLYQITENNAFEQVISHCAKVKRPDQDGTWILPEMQEAYIRLHKLGICRSVEVWKDGQLVGGLYGVETGTIFCGESMFSLAKNASKIALIWLCKNKGYRFIDCQFHTQHLESMGAELITRETYMQLLTHKL